MRKRKDFKVDDTNAIDYRGLVAPGIGVLKFSRVSSAPRPQDSTTMPLLVGESLI